MYHTSIHSPPIRGISIKQATKVSHQLNLDPRSQEKPFVKNEALALLADPVTGRLDGAGLGEGAGVGAGEGVALLACPAAASSALVLCLAVG